MSEAPASPIAVLGAGSWGTALAVLLARNGTPTLLWAHDPAKAATMEAQRCNARYLPEIRFPDNLHVTGDLRQALTRARDVLVAVPSHGFRETLRAIAPLLQPGARLAWASKGLEVGSHKLLHQICAEELGPDAEVAARARLRPTRQPGRRSSTTRPRPR